MSPEPLSLHQCSEEWPPQPAFSMALSAPGFPPAMTPQMDPKVLHRMQFPAPSEYARLTCLLRP